MCNFLALLLIEGTCSQTSTTTPERILVAALAKKTAAKRKLQTE